MLELIRIDYLLFSFPVPVSTQDKWKSALSEEAIRKFRTIGIDYAVSFTTQCISNLKGFAEEMLVHDHEEADTLILLHAADVSTRNPFSELHIYSPDTDVFFSLYTCTQTFVRMWYS